MTRLRRFRNRMNYLQGSKYNFLNYYFSESDNNSKKKKYWVILKMNSKLLSVAVALLVNGIFAIATASIGIECYDKQPEDFKKEKKTNYHFMIVTLVSAILMTIVALYSSYLGAVQSY